MIVAATMTAIAGWLYLVFLHGLFWRVHIPPDRDDAHRIAHPWPSIGVIVPARNEADVIATTLTALARQDYPGWCEITLVDDHSNDGTGAIARSIARSITAGATTAGATTAGPGRHPIHVITGAPLPHGWSGKLWALHQGMENLVRRRRTKNIGYWLLTDADIRHEPESLRQMVIRAKTDNRQLVSRMAMLDADTVIDKTLSALFIFFFRMIYPFAHVARADKKTAAAAGGCILIDRDHWRKAGGLLPLRGHIIDDCALARQMKESGAHISLTLSRRLRSLRPGGGLRGMWHCVTRTACAQLSHNVLFLAGCILAMSILYLWPLAVLVITPPGSPLFMAGLVVWITMAVIFYPTLVLYRIHPAAAPFVALSLPIGAAWFMVMTIASFVHYWRGRGAIWKNRAYHANHHPG